MKTATDLYIDLYEDNPYADEETLFEELSQGLSRLSNRYNKVLSSTYGFDPLDNSVYSNKVIQLALYQLRKYGLLDFVKMNQMRYEFEIFLSSNHKSKLVISESRLMFQVIKYPKNVFSQPFMSKPYSINNLLDVELLMDEGVIFKRSSNIGKAVVGGLLFGGVGVLAGALAPSNKETSKNKANYAVRLFLNDISMASIELPCESREIAHRILSTFELLEKAYEKKNSEKM
jgi:hypothetical protein